jgi:Tol biopolymer transport system component
MKRQNSIVRFFVAAALLAFLVLVLVFVFQNSPLRNSESSQQEPYPVKAADGIYPFPPGKIDPGFNLTATAEENALGELVPPTNLPPATLIPTPEVTVFPIASAPIIPPGGCPQPDRWTIFFRQGNALMSIDGDGSGETLIVDVLEGTGLYLAGTAMGVSDSDWISVSPDGRRIALVLGSDPGSAPRETEPISLAIYLFDRETVELNLLLEEGREPAWSPDGNRLAYLSGSGLWVMDLASGESREVYAEDEHAVKDLDWSPDGNSLVFIDEVFRQKSRIGTVEIQTGEIVFEIEHPGHFVYSPEWSPDGSRLLYLTTDGLAASSEKFFNLWLTDPDGSGRVQLTRDIQVASRPQWSPDSRWVVFAGLIPYEQEENYDLWVVDAEDSSLKRVTSTSEVSELSPVWSPDCASLYFSTGGTGTKQVSLEDGGVEEVSAVSGDFTISP